MKIGREREISKGNRTWSGSGSGAEFGILLLLFHLPFGSRYPWQRVHCSLAIQCANLILFTLDSHVHIRVHVPRSMSTSMSVSFGQQQELAWIPFQLQPHLLFGSVARSGFGLWFRFGLVVFCPHPRHILFRLPFLFPPSSPSPHPPPLSLYTSCAFFCLAAASGGSTQNTHTHTHTHSA